MEKSGLFLSARNVNLPPSDSQFFVNKVSSPRRSSLNRSVFSTKCSTSCVIDITVPPNIELPSLDSSIFCLPHYTHGVPQFFEVSEPKFSHAASELMQSLVLGDLDPATAKLVIGFLGPFLSAFGFLFILRIVMSWYPKLPVEKFPYIIAYAPTEPILSATRKLIPPLAGVDVTPVVWFGLISFLNEILVGPQGLLVLLSQQV